MINEQIMTYVAGERVRGVTDDAIRGALLTQGWKAEDVNSAMGDGVAVGTGVQKEFSLRNLFEGRLMRWQYFITWFLLVLACFLVGISIGIGSFFLGEAFNFVLFALYIFVIPLSFSLMIRRAHDLGWSGWTAVLSFVPIVNLVYGLLILFRKGTDGPNQYGQPQTDRSFKNTLLNL